MYENIIFFHWNFFVQIWLKKNSFEILLTQESVFCFPYMQKKKIYKWV